MKYLFEEERKLRIEKATELYSILKKNNTFKDIKLIKTESAHDDYRCYVKVATEKSLKQSSFQYADIFIKFKKDNSNNGVGKLMYKTENFENKILVSNLDKVVERVNSYLTKWINFHKEQRIKKERDALEKTVNNKFDEIVKKHNLDIDRHNDIRLCNGKITKILNETVHLDVTEHVLLQIVKVISEIKKNKLDLINSIK